MPHHFFLIQNGNEWKINYDRLNQLSCNILINNFTMCVKDYKQKANCEWRYFLESALHFISTPPRIHHYHNWAGKS